MDILKGDFSSTENKTLQVGANQAQTITIEISALTAVVDVAISDDLTIGTASAAQSSISHVQSAIEALSKTRSKLGALQNRLEHTVANLDNISENTQSAESRIRDTDMAEEMVQTQRTTSYSRLVSLCLHRQIRQIREFFHYFSNFKYYNKRKESASAGSFFL